MDFDKLLLIHISLEKNHQKDHFPRKILAKFGEVFVQIGSFLQQKAAKM